MDPLKFVNEEVPHLQESLMNPAWIVNDGGTVGFTQFTLWMIIIFALVLIVVLTAGRRLTQVPNNKFVNMVEYGYQAVRKNIAEGSIGHGYKKHVPFLATLFFFILIANFVGLIPGCKTPTGSLSITWALAIISFVYFNYWGIKTKGVGGYIKSIAPSGLNPFMTIFVWILEFVSLLLRALTLAVRLFGNMFAGHMALGIFSLLATGFFATALQGAFANGVISIGWIAFLVVMYALETLVAFIQAYVFTVLSAVYISLAVHDH
jgi:F-type H+-transporting ATPase subunit a